tara:strand:+ start:1204 stop:1398 length:195 start_codon:yes stop_codon:yes gene_type:complete
MNNKNNNKARKVTMRRRSQSKGSRRSRRAKSGPKKVSRRGKKNRLGFRKSRGGFVELPTDQVSV